jgi:hypothetical protein
MNRKPISIDSRVPETSVEVEANSANTHIMLSQISYGHGDRVSIRHEDWPRVREAIEQVYAARETPGGSPVPR